VGKPEWINDPRFATPEARTENAEELTRALEEIFLKRDWPEWRQIFTEAGITFGPIAEVADHISCPQVAANGLLPAFADGGGIRTVDSPIRLAGEIKTQPRIAPDIGQHSHAILRELGLSQSEVAKMFESGAAR
jgi:crotonobetainyl-CoA:carnitine CoA-transferase CaiB-like acyl-CoA transferase